MDTYIRDEAMIEDNVPSIPMKIWDWGIANREERYELFLKMSLN